MSSRGGVPVSRTAKRCSCGAETPGHGSWTSAGQWLRPSLTTFSTGSWPVLEPQERVLFTEALRPPEGYELSWAIGTTYTLDLVAALAAPLAFALFDWQQDDARPSAPDPVPLLEALRRHAGRLT